MPRASTLAVAQMLTEVTLRYFGDTEVFRTSTEEPNRRGISYTFTKDMSQYMALWKEPQKVIFDLPNTLTDVVSQVVQPPISRCGSHDGGES